MIHRTVLLTIITLFLVGGVGCKKKSEEERLEALYKKLDHAKGEEVDAIFEKIAKLSEQQERAEEKKLSNVSLKFGQWFTAEVTEPYTHDLISRYSIKFTKARYSLIGFTEDYKLRYIVDYQYRNLGPREGRPNIEKAEVKMRNGWIYPDFDDNIGSYRAIGPNQQGDGKLSFQIPFNSTPTEVNGRVWGSRVAFSLKLSEVPMSEAEVEVQVRAYNKNRIKVLRCYVTDLGYDPHIHLEYQNISRTKYQVLLNMCWRELNGKYTGQEDIRGPIGPSGKENLVYKLRVGSPEKILNYEIKISAASASGGGLPPVDWLPGKFPRVRPIRQKRNLRSKKSDNATRVVSGVRKQIEPPIGKRAVSESPVTSYLEDVTSTSILGIYQPANKDFGLTQLVPSGVQQLEVKNDGILLLSMRSGDKKKQGKWKPLSAPEIRFEYRVPVWVENRNSRRWRIKSIEKQSFEGVIQKDVIAEMDLRSVTTQWSFDKGNEAIGRTWRKHSKATSITHLGEGSRLWSRYTNPDVFHDIVIREDGTFTFGNDFSYTLSGNRLTTYDPEGKFPAWEAEVGDDCLNPLLAGGSPPEGPTFLWIKQQDASVIKTLIGGTLWNRYRIDSPDYNSTSVMHSDGSGHASYHEGEWSLKPKLAFQFQVGDLQTEVRPLERSGPRALDVDNGGAHELWLLCKDHEYIMTMKANLKILHAAVMQYKTDTGQYPSEYKGLMALVKKPPNVTNWQAGGYLETTEVPKDCWGHDFCYMLYPESGKPFVIISWGADGKPGGEGYDADIYSTDFLQSDTLIQMQSCNDKTSVLPKIHPNISQWQDLFAADLSNATYPDGVWTFEDGVLTASQDQVIWTKKDYDNFIIDLEFKTEDGTNSGVIVYCTNIENWIPNSIEIQISDDFSEKWAKSPKTWQCGAIFGHLAASKSMVKKPGQWNRFTITCKDKMIYVMLNDLMVTEMNMDLWTSGTKNPDGTDIPSWLSTPFAELPTHGNIGLQGKHAGAPIFFRNMKIKELEQGFSQQVEKDRERFLSRPKPVDSNQQNVQPAQERDTNQPVKTTVQTPTQTVPITLYFVELSKKDKIEAERLLNVAVPGRSIGRLPMTAFKLMVDNCRMIISRWPESWYAYRAKQMLADIPQRFWSRYKITEKEVDTSMYTKPRKDTKPFTFKEPP